MLRDEFAEKVRRKATFLRDIRDIVGQKLGDMLARHPVLMDCRAKYAVINAICSGQKIPHDGLGDRHAAG